MEITKMYLQKKFVEYYKKAKFEVKEMNKREWAFVPIKALPEFFMVRHIEFKDFDELKAYVLSNIPLHAYYSSAYYERPGVNRMEEKGWIGADLIFDIDSDHIPVREDKALEVAKKEIIRLAELLELDFGVEVKDISIVFSGSRGYHIHVHDKEFLQIDSSGRREIVNYFVLNRIGSKSVYPPSTQWERVCKCTAKLLLMILRGDFKPKAKEGVLESLKKKISKETLEKVSKGDFSMFKASEMRIVEKCIKSCIEKLKIHIDEPVTSDTHRLIRLPNSLHGKTGFVVKPLTLDSIEEFNPFRDALAFGEDFVKIRCLDDVNLSIGNVELKLKAGEKAKVPEYAAIYLICKRLALYGH